MKLKDKLYLNSLISLFNQICTVIIGLILPRLILQQFGSEVNGLLNSITQMLSVIALLDLGVGAVVQTALYKPLHDKDNQKISEIYSSSKTYFSLIAKILIVYIAILMMYYGVIKEDDFSWIYSVSLIGSVSISYFAQYYFGMSNTLLLNADQRIYVVTIVNLVTLFTNAALTVLLIYMGANIQLVKLGSSIVFLLRPYILHIYVKKNYSISIEKKPRSDAIPDKWSGMAQHIATVATGSVGNVVLTFGSTYSIVSIYNIYLMPLNAIKNLMEVTSTSYKSFFGNIIAQENFETLKEEFNKYEVLIHFLVVIIFGTVIKVLVPFVLIYSSVVSDANYKNEAFGLLISLAYAVYSIRLPYSNIIFAAGKFKETQKYSVWEVIINVVLSVLFVRWYGLVGVAIGTLASSAYRTCALVCYIKQDVLYREISVFGRQMLIDIICILVSMFITSYIRVEIIHFGEWILYAMVIFIVNICVTYLFFRLFYGEYVNIQWLIKRLRKKKGKR